MSSEDSFFLPDISEQEMESVDRLALDMSRENTDAMAPISISSSLSDVNTSTLDGDFIKNEMVDSLKEEDFDTDIEIDDDKLLGKKLAEDESLGTEQYKRSCSRLNIKPEQKVVENLHERTLNLKHQGLGEEGAKALAKSLLKNTNVERLFLEDNSITPVGVTFLSDMLCDNVYITLLDLSDNDVGTYGCLALKEMLTWNTTLTHLLLSNCKIKDSDIAILSEGIQRNETLVYLDLAHNGICEEGAMALGNAISINNSIENLNLSWNHIRRRGAVQICKGIKRNYCLVKVDLSWNGLGYEGSLAMGDTLKTNKYLRELDLSSNRITWNSATVLAAGLKDNDNLEILKIGLNPLTMTGALEIVSAVSNDCSEVEYIGLDGVPISRKIAYLAETIGKERDFSISHGGILDTEDVIGVKRIPQDDPLTRLLSFLNDRGIRVVDLFRSLDKDREKCVSRENFISGLKKAQVPLETWELQQVMEVLDKTDEGKIDYRKLNLGMKDQQILLKKKARRQKATERRIREEERQMLNPEMSPSPANSVRQFSSVAPSLRSSYANIESSGSRRSSRISLSVSQSIQDLRRWSSVNSRSLSATPNISLSKSLNSYRRISRDGEIAQKLGRLSLPPATPPAVSNRRISLVSK